MMQTIGSYLKSGREARNIGLSEVAESTKISKWYLDCLEKDEFDKIPGGPYIKGYIFSYASFIGIEEDEILKRYDSLQINSADENEIQDHRPEDKKRQKLIGLSFGKKNLLILSLAILVLLAFGIYYLFLQNQTHIVSQLRDAQDSKMQPAPSSKIKQEAASASHLTNLSKNDHLNPTQPKDGFHPTNQDDTGKESPSLLSSEQKVGGTPPAILLEESDINSQKATNRASVIHDAPPSSEINNVKRADLTDANNTLHQGTPRSADSYSETAPGNRTPDERSQAANNLRIIRAVAASDVINKNPAGLSDSFQWSTERVYIWSMVECERPPSSIRHTYYFKGQKVNDIVLEIKSPQWRTWSYKTLLDKRYIGQWKVDITSVEGELLQRIFFDVK